ncbi:MAG: sodium-dependent transporter [Spirochaetota bacterium]
MALERDRWTSRAHFIFAAIGSAIGLGNVWRFPYITYEYGGGAFLIPWIVGLIVMGVPWLMMEFGMGRYFQKGAPGVFEGVSKKLEWAGWWPAFTAFLIVSYYCVVMAWALRYAVGSLTLAWGAGQAGAQGAEPFFFKEVLNLSSGPGQLGGIQWPIVGFLAITWIVIFFIIFKGPRVSGKIAIWTVSIPWALLVAMLVRGLTLPGAVQGLNYYLTPSFSALGNIEVWFAALSQIAFTLSLGMAGMFAYGSFVTRKSDITNNAFITSFSNCATSFFAGYVVFSIVGFIMQALSISAQEVSASGLGLAFVTYPVGISMMPTGGRFFGFIFFMCLWFLGVDSAFFLTHGGVVTPIWDKFNMKKERATALICILGFLVGLLFTTQGGLFWLDIIDRAFAFYGLILTGAVATIIIGWVFTAEKLRQHINETSDIKVGRWWNWLLKVVVPAGLLFVVIYGGFAKDFVKPYGGYGGWSSFIWILLAATLGLSFLFQAFRTRTPK